jgi:hypothetical protein
MREAGTFYILFIMLFSGLLSFGPVAAQTTDEEIKLVKEKIEQLNARLKELEAAKSEGEQEGTPKKSDASIPDPVTFLNSSGAGIKKTSEPKPPKTLFTGSGSVNLADSDDSRKFNALFSPLFHRQLANNLYFILKPEFKLEQDNIDVGLGVGEVDLFLNNYLTIRGGKLQSPFTLLSENSYASRAHNTQYLPALYHRMENKPGKDILSDLRNMGIGISGGIPLKFFEGASIDYGISFVNGESGPGIMNFSFSISRK